jgi:beta-xylosidase
LHYSGESKVFRRHHCVAVAVSEGKDPLGPYKPEPEPLACHLDDGGAIDSAGFADSDGTPYVLYKIDGNSIGNGGDCNNAIDPIMATPIMLQKLKTSQVSTDGGPIQILDREESDGPLVEAPSLVKSKENVYFLFFSSHCFTSLSYNVNYATAESIKGPYTRAERPLLQTGDFGLVSPGGATVSKDGTKILFHGNCSPGRCMYAGNVTLSGTHASVDLFKEGNVIRLFKLWISKLSTVFVRVSREFQAAIIPSRNGECASTLFSPISQLAVIRC